MSSSLPVFRTERLLIRPWEDADYPAFLALHLDADVAHWLGGYPTPEHARQRLDHHRAWMSGNGWGLWALEMTAGVVVGAAGFQTVPADLPVQGTEATWRLRREAWGQGLATEAMGCLLDHAFLVLDWPEVVTFTAQANERSQRVMQRLGFERRPDQDFAHPRLPEGHFLRPHVFCALSQSRWRTWR